MEICMLNANFVLLLMMNDRILLKSLLVMNPKYRATAKQVTKKNTNQEKEEF